ncbi:MAG TPA: MIP family channel protein [Methylomirabilota bacterium]|jgi:MIP family channel proteins|nr:MIP family channel protein [Methylomirabilota bacterium]
MNSTLLKQCVAEFVGTFALIFIGVGVIANHANLNSNAGLLAVALAHGLTIAVMVSATGAISGGHLNPAVTFGLWVGAKIDSKRAAAYWIAQLSGAVIAAAMVAVLLNSADTPGKELVIKGTPAMGKGATALQSIGIEAVLTFFLVFVVYGSAVDVRAPKIGGLAIGLTVALDILFGGPFTGAAMNPARTFGPALVGGLWANHYVYWVGPLLGGALAGLVYGRFLIQDTK